MSAKICPRCGSDIDPAEARGFCPSCLLKEAARPEPDGDRLRAALEGKLRGQYRLIRLVGRGGMGAVYLARDLTLDREVAIKVVRSVSGDRGLYERLRREAKTAARLSHPNIVPLYAFGEVEGMPYFVMGYVRGESLAERLRRDGSMPEEDVRRVIGEIADALDHAHRQGVVHRDVKPDNVLLDDETGRALLTDFGVAIGAGADERITQDGAVIGTPHYMSPEQAEGRIDVDARSDIYSLGVMAYAMLTGRVPFEGSLGEVLTRRVREEPPPLRSLLPTLSDTTVQVVERCLRTDPAARFQDARSVRMALGRPEERQLPFALQSVESGGLPGLIVVLVSVALAYLVDQLTGAFADADLRAVHFPVVWYGTFPALMVFFYALSVVRLEREGVSFREAQILIWREPAWWPISYPRALRRAGNVWDRFPAAIRQYRLWPISFVVWAVVFVIFGETMHPGFFVYTVEPVGLTVAMVTLAAIIATWIALWHRGARMLRRAGIGSADIPRVMYSIPPSRVSFWSMPHIAPILAPAPAAERQPRETSPHDRLLSILRAADELTGPLRPLGAQAAAAARQLIASIEQSDREIAGLARNLDTGEEERLTAKIASLDGDDEYAPIRGLLDKQLELVRQISARVDDARAKRDRRVEMLNTLALHVASLRARVKEPGGEIRSLTEEVLALCDEIGQQAETAADRERAELPTVDRSAATLEQM